MRVSDNEAAQRVADNDNLVGELVEALKYARRFLNSKDHDTGYVDDVLAKAKGAQQ